MLSSRHVTLSYLEYDAPEELDISDRELAEAAKEAAHNAYALKEAHCRG